MIKISFIGVGGIAGRHIRSLRQLQRSEFVAFCDIVSERAKQAADENGGSAYTDFQKMLDKEELDAVFICTPPFVRAEPIVAAATKGAAIFSEKPPAFDTEQGQKALAAIQEAGVVSNVGFMYRWMKAVDQAKELMAGKKISAIRSVFLCGPAVHMNIPGWFYMKDKSGGPLMDQAIHVLDLHRYLAGEVECVHAFGNNQIQSKRVDFTVEETVTLNLRYDSGIIASHTHSWACDVGIGQVELISDFSRITIDLFAKQVFGTVEGEKIDESYSDDCYLTEIDNFLTAVETTDQSRMRSSYQDGLNTCAVTWAGLKSIETGQVETPMRF
jgi:predicted dehydrogenase